MQLSKRMEALAALVSDGNRLADIGTDHAYIPIALVQRGQIPSALAMDLREGPLARARAHIEEAGLSDRIETRLSDGLAALPEGDADTILIAGMGGALTMRILAACPQVAKSAKELILQPQSEIDKVRTYVVQLGFAIAQEDIVFEDGNYYPMMRLVPQRPDAVQSPGIPQMSNVLTEAQAAFGPCLLEARHPVLLTYLQWEQAQCEALLKKLAAVDNLRTQARAESVAHRLKLVRSCLEWREK